VDTATRVLDIAEELVQRRGFNGFSYADIAAEIGTTKAALHYHFPNKAALGDALVIRYTERFRAAIDGIDRRRRTPPDKLRAYADLYRDVLRDRRMCLCGMLAAEFDTLPPSMRTAIVAFFDHNEAWLSRVLDEGRSDGSMTFTGPVRDTARLVISALEGAVLVSRTYAGLARFRQVADRLLALLIASPAAPGIPD
jgi:TetR/AcrR family transcriptional repressor of nem operon